MEFSKILNRSISLRHTYHELEEKYHGSKWSIEEDLLALSNDIGNMNRLIMTKKERYYDETPYDLEGKLVENIWWLLSLSDRLDIDVEKEMEKFLSAKERELGIVNKDK